MKRMGDIIDLEKPFVIMAKWNRSNELVNEDALVGFSTESEMDGFINDAIEHALESDGMVEFEYRIIQKFGQLSFEGD